METVYTLKQIKDHWHRYKTMNCYKVLKGGKSLIRFKPPDISGEAVTKCEMVKVYKVMEFPKYLGLVNGG